MVGWDQLFRGRFVTDWARIQDCYLGSLPKVDRKKSLSGRRWVVAMTRIIWTHYFELWEGRNKAVHGVDKPESLSKVKQKLLAELRLVHEDRLKYLEADRKFLIAETIEDSAKLEAYVQDHYPSTVRNWLDWHIPLFKASIQEAQAKAVSLVRPITDYSDKPEVEQLCRMLGYGQVGQRAAQVAAWHLNNGMSFQELAAKELRRANGLRQPYFSPLELQAGMQATAFATKLAREQEAAQPQSQSLSQH